MSARDERGPNPHLVAWLRTFTASPARKRCLVVGCGLGDDAEALASAGFEVTAIDSSPAVVEAAQQRFRRSGVDYVVGDVLDPPDAWGESFDLVFASGTQELLPPHERPEAMLAIARLVAPGGRLFVVGSERDELATFEQAGLRILSVDEGVDDGRLPGRHVRAMFDRPLA
jgi:2-polyprenyl-3-methyl-5-hydroxy-6-metoxy-1,4-benzoquinol methylase